jgi:hypothetical protein
MLPVGKQFLPPVLAKQAEPPFCPECGQPLTFVRPRAEPRRERAVAWRSLFVIAVGLYLAVAFGIGAWHAAQTLQRLTGCTGASGVTGCTGLPRDLALAIASRNIATADAFRVRTAEIALGHDARFAVLGLIGLVIGLGAILLRSQRARLRRLSFDIGLWIGAEALVALFFGQVLLISAYHLAADVLAGAPFTLDAISANLDRALSTFFALAGIW